MNEYFSPEQLLYLLQDEFATLDERLPLPPAPNTFPNRAQETRAGVRPLVLKRIQAIRIRMDGNRNHQRAHVHIDYGPEYHVASYAIDTGERLGATSIENTTAPCKNGFRRNGRN